MTFLLILLTLYGYVSNEYGRAGVLISKYGRISHVYRHSPAFDAGLKPGDVVTDPKQEDIDGCAGEWVTLTISRKKQTFIVHIQRVPKRLVYD